MDAIALIAAVAAGAAVLLLIVAFLTSTADRATDRLAYYVALDEGRAAPDAPTSRVKGSVLSSSVVLATLNRLVERGGWSERIANRMARADLALKPGEYVAFRVFAIVVAILVCYLLGAFFATLTHPLALAGAALLGLFVPHLWLSRREGKRLSAFNAGLADTITLIANSLRSGGSLLQAIELVSRETSPPVSTEFARVVREVTLGRTLEQALENLVRRVRSDDLELMATAIAIQYQVGGNLAEILDSIATTIRERVRIRGEIRTLTAQQRLSGYIVGFLPVGIAIMLLIISPKFMAPMFEGPPNLFGIPLGLYLFALGGIVMMIGFAIIRRIVNIKI